MDRTVLTGIRKVSAVSVPVTTNEVLGSISTVAVRSWARVSSRAID